MPIYEYQCEKCSETTEILQKFSDAPMTLCPTCGGHMEKLMSMNSFQLKGSGWYVTDYKAKSDSATAPPKGDEAGTTPAKESSPAATTTTTATTTAASPAATEKTPAKA